MAPLCEGTSFDGAGFTVCRFDAADDIRLFWGAAEDTPFANFDTVAGPLNTADQNLVFAMNGGMYQQDRRPAGLYIENGKTVQKINTNEGPGNFHLMPNGVFLVMEKGTEPRVRVMQTSEYLLKNIPGKPQFATQSGPMLVINGELHPKFRADSDSLKLRNGVGVSADGKQVYFVITEAPVNFHHFGRLFKDELGTPNALYLDGVVSRLYDASSGRNDPGMPMGPIVGVVR